MVNVAYVDIFKRYGKNVVEQEGGARPGVERGETGGGQQAWKQA
jgi:hypothetical protein